MMTQEQALMVAQITNLIVTRGIPAAMEIMQTWQMDREPTMEEIRALPGLVPPGETYFDAAE